MKAKVLVASTKYQEAYDYLAIIGDDDGSVDYLQVRIECMLNLDKVDEANQLVDRTLAASNLDGIDLYTFLSEVGYMYNDVDMHDKAVSMLEAAYKIDDSDIVLLIDLSYAYEMLSNFQKSIEINNLILDIDPYSFEGWVIWVNYTLC